MNKVVKLIFGLVFTLGTYITASAQTAADSLAKDDAIVCRQISDNVFDCYVKEGNTDQKKMNENGKEMPKTKEENEYPRSKEEAPMDWNRSDVNGGNENINKEQSAPIEKKESLNNHKDSLDVPSESGGIRMYEYNKSKLEQELINEADDEIFYQKKRDSLGVQASKVE